MDLDLGGGAQSSSRRHSGGFSSASKRIAPKRKYNKCQSSSPKAMGKQTRKQKRERRMQETWRRSRPAPSSRKERRGMRRRSVQLVFTFWWTSGKTVKSFGRSVRTKTSHEMVCGCKHRSLHDVWKAQKHFENVREV